MKVVEDDGCQLERGLEVVRLTVDIFAPPRKSGRIAGRRGESERGIEVDGPMQRCCLVGEDYEKIVCELGVMDGK